MSSVERSSEPGTRTSRAGTTDLKLEVVVIPVSDIDRAKSFYTSLGWRLDADVTRGGFRLIQISPPGSACSIQFGTDMSSSAPGSASGLYLVVSDVEVARAELIAHGAEVTEVFHEEEIGAAFTPSARTIGSAVPRRGIRVTARSPRSRTRTATAGCCKRSPRDCRGGSIPRQRRLRPPPNCQVRFGAPKRRTVSTRPEPARQTRTGRTGMPSTWFASRRGRSCRHE